MSDANSSQSTGQSLNRDEGSNARFAEATSQSPFVRSLQYRDQDASYFLDGRNESYRNNINAQDSTTGSNRTLEMFQDIPSIPLSDQNLNHLQRSETQQMSGRALDRFEYSRTAYEQYLYQQYYEKDRDKNRKEAGNNSRNDNNNDLNNINSNQFNQRLGTTGNNTNNRNTETLHDESSLISSRSRTKSASKVPAPAPDPPPPPDELLQHTQISKPNVVLGKPPHTTFPPSSQVIQPTKIPCIQLPLTLYHANLHQHTPVPEWMMGEFIEETTNSSSSTRDHFEKHLIPCTTCNIEFRVYKLASLVSCPGCKTLLPNSRFGKDQSEFNVARKFDG